MDYKVTNKYVEVTISSNDVDSNCNENNIYSYMPREVQDFYNKNKEKPNFRETKINGRYAPYSPSTENSVDGITFIFELI